MPFGMRPFATLRVTAWARVILSGAKNLSFTVKTDRKVCRSLYGPDPSARPQDDKRNAVFKAERSGTENKNFFLNIIDIRTFRF
jgi:hypothetical protein